VKRHAHSFLWFLYWFLAIVFALVAGLSLVVKLVVDDLGHYRQNIEEVLSSQLQAKVHLVSINGSWDGWQPVVELKGLSIDRVSDQPGLSLALMDATIKLDPSESLAEFSPVFSQLDLADLTVRYDLAQRVQSQSDMPDIEDRPSAKSETSNFLTFLLQQRSIRLDDTKIVLSSEKGEEVSVSPIQLRLQHDGLLHQLKVDADLEAGDNNASIRFVAEVEGSPSRNPVDFYLEVDGLDQGLLNPWLGLASIQVRSLKANQEVWGQFYRGRLTYLTGKTDVQHFQYQEYALERFDLHTALIRRDKGYQLQLTDLYIDAAKSKIDLPKVSLDLERQAGQVKPRKLMIDKIELSSITNWLLEQPFIPSEITDILTALSPEGVVENVTLDWSKDAELEEFQLNGDLLNVGINAWDDVPELKGINGLLEATKDSGKIHLVSNDFAMKYPTLFDYRWTYPYAEGIVGWRFEDEGVVVASQLLKLKNSDLSASGRFSVYLPFSKDKQPLLNLQIGLQSSDGLQAKYYIPPEEVGEATYEWLVEAIKAGHINRAGFVLNGVTRSRLSDYQLPSVQLFFDISDATFNYQPGWPGIKGANTFVYFRNGELIAEASKGGIYDSSIDHAWVHLPSSGENLLVAGSVAGKAEDIQRLFIESDLRQEVGSDLDEWAMSGNVTTQLELDLPLAGKQSPSVLVQTELFEGGFNSEKERINFTNIKGLIRYDSKSGLSAPKLTASLFDQSLVANIKTEKKKTQISIKSKVATEYLKRWLELDLLSIMKGTLSYHARVDLCPNKSCNKLVITSDLKGVEVSAPAPIGKRSADKSSLTVVSDLGTRYNDERSVIRLNMGNQLRGVMVNKSDQVERARFSLGGKKPEIPAAKGIWVDGHLERLNYKELDQFLMGAGLTASNNSQAASAGPSNPRNSALEKVALSLGVFEASDYKLTDLMVELKPEPLGWMLNVDSDDLSGRLWLPDDASQPYRVNLQRLVLESDSEEAEKEGGNKRSVEIKPEDIPSLNVSIDSLNINQKALGQWRFQLRPTENGARVSDITADMHGAKVNGELRWSSGAEQISDLTVKLKGQDFKKVLDAWGISESIETKSLEAYLQLSWNKAPWEFELGQADGELQFTAKDGRILDVGKSGNILRVFGILNLQSLGRRLRLDFTDLVESGVAFDEMKASYSILKGIARTTEPFVMTGPSANMAMQGQLDLVNETVDKDIEVALPVTGSIPLVSVLLGAPQVAGAVFLFDKLIGDPLAKFTTVKYHLSGDWGDPVIDIDESKKK